MVKVSAALNLDESPGPKSLASSTARLLSHMLQEAGSAEYFTSAWRLACLRCIDIENVLFWGAFHQIHQYAMVVTEWRHRPMPDRRSWPFLIMI